MNFDVYPNLSMCDTCSILFFLVTCITIVGSLLLIRRIIYLMSDHLDITLYLVCQTQ